MTSAANVQNVPAPPPSAPAATASYASAVGASGKAAAAVTPVIVTGSGSAPVVVSSAATPPTQPGHHAKSASVSPLNGKPNTNNGTMAANPGNKIIPAVPAVINGSNDNARKSSVTISATGPSGYVSNGGPAGAGPKAGLPKFGYESPAIIHSTPSQNNNAVPIPIPGHQHIPSPAPSPSPIPQPSASGGRPPSTMSQDGSTMKFGSLGGDGDRHMKQHVPGLSQNTLPVGNQSPNFRRGSTHSIHSDMGNHVGHNNHNNHPSHAHHGGPPNRGGYSQAGRGRGYNQYNNQPMGYQAGGGSYPRGPAQGRGGMPSPFQPRNMPPPFVQNSPQAHSASPAMSNVVPATGTPLMQPVIPTNTGGNPGYIGYSFPQPTGFPPQINNYQPYPTQFGPQGMMGYGGYNQMSFIPPQQPQGPPYTPVYGQIPYVPPGPQPMSRNNSQMSERPTSSTGQIPAVGSGAFGGPSGVPGGPPKTTSAPSFVIPRKSAAIVIKNPHGEIMDFKQPASPVPAAVPVVKTPPVINPTPTPPPKSVTPLHVRAESSMSGKTAEQLRNEFKEQVRKTAEVPTADGKPAEEKDKPAEEPRVPAAAPIVVSASTPAIVSTVKAEEKKEEAPVVVSAESAKPAVKVEVKAEVKPEVKAEPEKTEIKAEVKEAKIKKVEERTEPREEPKAEPKVEAKVEAKVEKTEAKVEPKTETKTEVKTEAKTETKEEPKTDKSEPAADEEDEMERMIREMEEAEAKREAEEAAYAVKKKQLDEEKKKKEAADRAASALENDRKLREQEREMERLEEERERQRKQNETAVAAGGKAKSVAEMLTEKISDLTLGDRKEAALSPTTSTDGVASKLGNLKLSGHTSPLSESAPGSGGKAPRNKPSALNLTQLNTKSVEPPQPSAALQSLKTARFLRDPTSIAYPKGIMSPNPALNLVVNKKGNFKYDMGFLLQFKDVFTEKPSLDFDQQVKQLIGDGDSTPRGGSRTPASGSVRQNSRTAGSGGFGSGVMGEFASKTLPPGTTSEQRFAMSSGSMPRPMSGMGFGRPGSFPGPSHLTRTPSSNVGGGIPGSPRQGSRSTRGGSRRDNYGNKSEAQAAKTMPLTQGMELKPIVVSSNGWKPSSIGNRAPAQSSAGPNGMMDPSMVQRKVKAALNKMTPEKFDKISDQILEIALQSKDEEDGRTLRQVIQLTFEKATDEAHWAPMYARFCKRMLDMMSPEIRDTTIKDRNGNVISGGTLFRKYLLNRCQEEFERGWKVDLPQPKDGETKEAVLLSDEYYEAAAAKRRGLGLVQFIGELYKLGMLTERIMHECVRKLVDYETTPDEAEIESLSKLLRTVGGNLDSTEKGRPMMDAYFVRIKNMIDIPDLPSRLKFMLMDIVDLRAAKWISDEANKGPKTLEEVRQEAEAAAAQKAAEATRSSNRGGGGGMGGGRGGRGDGRQFAYNQQPTNQVGMDDLRRLKNITGRVASANMTLGPTSMFTSRSNSGRRNGPGSTFGRGGDDSGPGSRVGTPLTRTDSNSVSHLNAFQALANVDTESPASPPSTAASPAMAKASLGKKDGN